MKIKFSYQPGEEKWAYLVSNLVIATLCRLAGKNPRVKERQDTRRPSTSTSPASRPSPMMGMAVDLVRFWIGWARHAEIAQALKRGETSCVGREKGWWETTTLIEGTA